MATTYTTNAHLGKPAVGDTGFSPIILGDFDALDAMSPIGGLVVVTKETPSTTLNVSVAAGNFIAQDGSVNAYAGTATQAIPTATTRKLFLDGTASWALTVAASYPATPHVRLATVVAGATTITSVTDERMTACVAGSIADGVNWAFGTTTGTKIGTAAGQKLSLWNATPVVQPSGAAQVALTNSSGGTTDGTISAVGATNSGDVSGAINNNFAELYVLLNAIRSALVSIGAMKGSA